MAALPPRSSRRRPRRGSLERPVSGRLYRGTWLLVGIPLLVAAFSVHKPGPLPTPQPALPASFDGPSAIALASELSRLYPDRAPGSAGAVGAAQWFRDQLAPYRLHVEPDRFRANVPGLGERVLINQVVTIPGQSPDEIAILAHRDDSGVGPGANNNASGIAALIQLARSYGTAAGARPVSPQHTLVFVATDGGAFGDLGARHFAETRPGQIVAAVALDSIAGDGRPRLVLIGNEPRLASPGFVETAAQRVLEQSGERPAHPDALAQLIDLGFPFTLHEQGPLLAQGIPALTLTSGGERPPNAFTDQPGRLNQVRLAELGRATQQLVGWLDGGAELAPGTARYVYFGPRVLPGWAIELVLLAALLPFLRVGGRPVRALPPSPHSADAGAAKLPQPRRVLALGRDPVRAVRPDRRLAALAGGAAATGLDSGDELAGDRLAGAGRPRRARLAGREASPRSSRAGFGDRGARRHDRGAAGSGRGRAARCRDEPLRADLPAAVAARLAVAAPRATAADLDSPGRARRGLHRAAAARGLVRGPLPARARHALVSRRARRHRLRQAPRIGDRGRLARRRGADDCADRRPLRSLSERPRATTARAAAGGRPPHGSYSESYPADNRRERERKALEG